MPKIPIALVATAAVAAVVVTGVAVMTRGGDHGRYVSDHPQTVPRIARTVLVSRTTASPSVDATHLSATLVSGRMPLHAVRGEVLTDTDCTPDRAMISRCRNVVKLGDGSTIVLRHPHDMRRVPCLAPHEQIVLRPVSGWRSGTQ